MESCRTLLDRLAQRAREESESTAFHFAGESCSLGELWSRAGAFAGVLRERGLSPGERTVVAEPNGAGFFTAFYGIQLGGGVPVPLYPGSGARRLIAMAERCGARVVVASGLEDPSLGALRSAGLVHLSPREAAGMPDASSDVPPPDPETPAYIQYTSGSTGEPKGVEVRHGALLTNIRQMIAGMEITTADVFVSWLPVHHDMGLVLMTMVPLYLGLPLFLLPTTLRDPGLWLGEIQRCRGTFTAAPDFAYRVALRHLDGDGGFDLSTLRVALNAAEPVRARTVEEFERRFGLRHVMMPAYGLAEATVGVSMCAPGEPVRVDRRGFVCVGRPFPEVEIVVLADDRPAPPGAVGEILVRSPANTRGYWRDAEATGELFWGDGYIRTGDLGYVDRLGALFVVGRRKNLIIQGGRNIAPREVEEAIDRLPFVRSAAAVGFDRGGDEGEQVVVFAELRREHEGARAEYAARTTEIVAAVHRHLGLRPGRTYLVPVGGIPRTPNGKVRYVELRQGLLDGTLRAKGRLLYPNY